jgi:hypothetical protein
MRRFVWPVFKERRKRSDAIGKRRGVKRYRNGRTQAFNGGCSLRFSASSEKPAAKPGAVKPQSADDPRVILPESAARERRQNTLMAFLCRAGINHGKLFCFAADGWLQFFGFLLQ